MKTHTLLKMICLLIAAAFLQNTVISASQKNGESGRIDFKNETPANGDTVRIWNGKDLEGLKLILKKTNPDEKSPYKIVDGAIHFWGVQNGYFMTPEIYSDYKLHVEWRWPGKNERGNSGVLIHVQEPDTVWPKCIQVQLKTENAGDFIAMNGAMVKEAKGKFSDTAPKLNPSNEKPETEWNECDIICSGDSVMVYVNGLLQNKGTQMNVKEGTIGFQLESKPIEFRNIYLIKNK